jgi:hypothetical protein
MLSCNDQLSTEQENNNADDRVQVTAVPLDNGMKWKADEGTKKNVAALIQVLNDTVYADDADRTQLYTDIRAKIDVLVAECTMKGEAHQALHNWLQIVLKDVKELKEGNNEYNKAYAALKKDVESFYQAFE